LFESQSLSVDGGHTLVVRGPSGVGKSKLLRSISCLDCFSAGTVTLNGKPPQHYGLTNWRARVIYVSQSRVTIKGTVREHFLQVVDLGAQKQRLAREGVAATDLVSHLSDLLHSVGLEDRESGDGAVASFLDRTWESLSGGEYQRAALCCALALKPPVLLLDEPTSALDKATALRVERVLDLSAAALVWVTHDPEQAQRLASGERAGRTCTLTVAPYCSPALEPAPLRDEAAPESAEQQVEEGGGAVG
jgi:putative ABC transport system ATP-binding protein